MSVATPTVLFFSHWTLLHLSICRVFRQIWSPFPPSRSAGGLLPAGQGRLCSGRWLELLLPPHLGQDLLNLPLRQLRGQKPMIRQLKLQKGSAQKAKLVLEVSRSSSVAEGNKQIQMQRFTVFGKTPAICRVLRKHDDHPIISGQTGAASRVSAVPRTDHPRLEVPKNPHRNEARQFKTSILNSVEISQIQQIYC